MQFTSLDNLLKTAWEYLTSGAVIRIMAAAFAYMMKEDRDRLGFTPARAAGHLWISRGEYLELEASTRWPSSTVCERMVALYGWPQASSR